MWNRPHTAYGYDLERESHYTECFKNRDTDCYHDLTTNKYYAFLGFLGSKKVEADTREELENIIINS